MDVHTGLLNTLLCLLHMTLWKEMLKGFSICHIKAEIPVAPVLPPVPNFLSPRHAVVPSIIGKIHHCIPHCMVSLRHRHKNQGRTGDILNPLSQTDDAMLQQFTPSLTQFRNYHLEESADQPSLKHQGGRKVSLV